MSLIDERCKKLGHHYGCICCDGEAFERSRAEAAERRLAIAVAALKYIAGDTCEMEVLSVAQQALRELEKSP